MKNRVFRAVEIFSGGGGLAVGLKRSGFDLVAAVEVEKHAATTFKANHPQVQVYMQDVRSITGEMLAATTSHKIDVLAACPPCQGFSSLTYKWNKEDKRNNLVSEVARLAGELRPTAIMMENVPGLAKKGLKVFQDLLERLEIAGYKTRWSILQVANFGVPQFRRRLVLLAGLGFYIPLPEAKYSKNGENGKPRWRTVRDTISGIEEKPITFTKAKDNGGAQAFNWHVVRQLSSKNIKRLKAAQPGGNWEDFPENLRPPCHRNGYKGFSNVYGRMEWDKPSCTITGGCTTFSKGRFGHPDQDRTISLREAALLQTFPIEYRFDTPYFERACEIVGNALPCKFAEAIGHQVHEALIANKYH